MLRRDSAYPKGKEREPRLVQPTFYTVAQVPPTCTFGEPKELGDQVPVLERRLLLAVHLLGTTRPLGQVTPQVSF